MVTVARVRGIGGEEGSSLLAALLVVSLVAGIAVGLALVVQIEVRVANHHRLSAEALAGAEAGVEVVVAALRSLADWTPVVNGSLSSPLAEGGFSGRRALPGGGSVVLCCAPGSLAARLSDETRISASPGRRSIRWSPFLWTRLDALAERDPPSTVFLVVWVGNDEADRDGGGVADTNGLVLVRSEAWQSAGIRRVVEALVGRPAQSDGLTSGVPLPDAQRQMRVGILRWREVR
jgi:hypothetical protein